MRNYKYRICCKETAQPIRDNSYPPVTNKPNRDKVAGDGRKGTLSAPVRVGLQLLGRYSTVSVCES